MTTSCPPEFEPTFLALESQLRELIAQSSPCVIMAIPRGGQILAEALIDYWKSIDFPLPIIGGVDPSFYRDDLMLRPPSPLFPISGTEVEIDQTHVILLDDVVESGRTIRAALSELFDRGRPASVLLAALIDRGGRMLPIQPDITGARVSLPADQNLKLIPGDGDASWKNHSLQTLSRPVPSTETK